MKRIFSSLVLFVLVIGLIYGCAAARSSTPPASDPSTAEESQTEETSPTILLCLPRDGEDHTLLRNAFTAKVEALGYTAAISEPAADTAMTDEQVWDIEQLQYQAQAVIVYQCDGTEEGLVKKWADAGVAVIAAGKRLDGQATDEAGSIGRRVRANVAYADGSLAKALATHLVNTLSASKAGAGFIGLYGDTDANLDLLGFVRADIQLTETFYTPNEPIAATDASAQIASASSAKAILYAGREAESWANAMAGTKASTLCGLSSSHPAAFAALQAGKVDFLILPDPVDLMDKAVQAAHTLLDDGQGLAEWNIVANALVLTTGDPKLATYLSYNK